MNQNRKKNIDFIEFNLKKGRKTFSFSDLVNYKGNNTNAAKQYIKYSIKRQQIKNLSEGYYAIYSPTEKDTGNIPPDDIIDQLMSFKQNNYYTGLLSAAAYFGATHYRPIVYQVITQKQVHKIKNVLSGINFHRKKHFPENCIIKRKGNYGYINYSSAALTAYDLFKYEKESGTISNIIPVISEMIPQIKISDIKNLLKNTIETSYIQRMGYTLEKLGAHRISIPLLEYSKKATAYIPLSRLGNKSGTNDNRWKIIENIDWRDYNAP